MSIITITIGLVVWLVVPFLTNDMVKKKSYKKAIARLCRIIGIAIIVVCILNYLTSLFQ